MIVYLMKGILCSAVLWLFHCLFLERERLHTFNRFFLLLAPLVAFAVPFIPLRETEQAIPEMENLAILVTTAPQNVMPLASENPGISTDAFILWALLSVYLLGVLIRLARLVWGIRRLKKLAVTHTQYPTSEGIVICIPDHPDICTFMQYIFCDKDAYENGFIPKQVLRHEFAHLRQKHSWDILYMELIGALYWFNPMLMLYRRSVVLNHEFLADREVNQTYQNISAYQTLLIERLTGSPWEMASGFNYSETKKRLIMMTQNKNWTRIAAKGMALLVITGGMTYVAADEAFAQRATPRKENSGVHPKSASQQPATKSKSENIWVDGPGLTTSELADYQASFEKHLQVKTNAKGSEQTSFSFSPEERERLWQLHLKMTRVQRRDQKYEIYKMPLPRKDPPTRELFEKFKNPDSYGVWIDGKKVENAVLNKYTANDIAEYGISKLHGKAKIGRRYTHQLDMTTNRRFDATYDERVKDPFLIIKRDEPRKIKKS